MNAVTPVVTAVNAPTQFVEVDGRKLAYRSIGVGVPLVLCVRFRGTMDVWDPAFLDALVAEGFQVVTFDYSGLGASTGEKTLNPFALAKDAGDLIKALDLKDIVLGGWSLGGLAAQAALALFPDQVSHLVLVGTGPPGVYIKQAEQLFYDTARKDNDFEDEVILFFEPKSPASRAAAQRSHDRIAARTVDLSPPVPREWAAELLGDKPKANPFPAEPILDLLKSTDIPILHVGGDHDISFPIENWYALNQALPTLQLLTFPKAGHGPQHEHPEASAAHIATFVRTTSRGG
jgi:pimeloyl-ACP methyl ester carboxylesterase